MSKYQTLVNILDELRKEAPTSFKNYYPMESEVEKKNQALSRCFSHLFLKVKFGLLDFQEREKYITDGPYDGGIDAYFIDETHHKIYLLQAKFRTTEKNFEDKCLETDELLAMDANRITRGEIKDEDGNEYNSKIQTLIQNLQRIPDISRYNYEVIILANIKKYKPSKMEKIISGFPFQVIDFEKCYDELVFPVVCGSYFYTKQLIMNINLTNKEISSSKIRYPVQAKAIDCEISVLFVPTLEIAEKFNRLKNSILKFNPRSYLGLSRNPVNRNISKTLSESLSNEFALYNNGITILSDNTLFQEKVGKLGQGQLSLENPQIINGAQTAYTLSLVYEEALKNNYDLNKIFKEKEVMLKVITFPEKDKINEKDLLDLITEISKATNLQTAVKEADRRANDTIQINLQHQLFQKFGFFYERKRGEFFDGISNKYISRDKLINRQDFLRALYSISGYPAQSARTSERFLFKKDLLKSLIKLEQIDFIFFGYRCFTFLRALRKQYEKEINNKFGVANFGNGLENGILAVTYVTANLNKQRIENIDKILTNSIMNVLKVWLQFEEFAKSQKWNSEKFFKRITDPESGAETIETDFFRYYRGDTLKRDLDQFFKMPSTSPIPKTS